MNPQRLFIVFPRPRRRFVLGVMAIALFFVSCVAYGGAARHTTVIMPTGKVIATLHSTNQSGVTGTATLTPNRGGFTISIALQGATVYPPQGATVLSARLARVQTVSCNAYAKLTRATGQRATLGKVVLAVSNGRSVTQVNGPVSRFATGTYSISVESRYGTLACGDIPYLSNGKPVGDAPCMSVRALARASRCYLGDFQ
jgi:hypothetical protein